MYVGFAAECEIKDLLRKDLVSINNIKEIKNDGAQFIIALMKKIFERCPLGSVVIRNTDVSDSNYMLRWLLGLRKLRSLGKVEILQTGLILRVE